MKSFQDTLTPVTIHYPLANGSSGSDCVCRKACNRVFKQQLIYSHEAGTGTGVGMFDLMRQVQHQKCAELLTC